MFQFKDVSFNSRGGFCGMECPKAHVKFHLQGGLELKKSGTCLHYYDSWSQKRQLQFPKGTDGENPVKARKARKNMVSKTRSWNAHYCLIHIVLYLKIIPRVFQVETNPKSYRDALYLAFSSWVLYQTPDSFRHRTKMGVLLLLIKFLSEFLTVFVLDMGAGSFWNSSCP